jgi:HlyD family secretion protein
MSRKHDQVLAVPILAVTTRDKNEENADAKAKAKADKKKASTDEDAMNETISLDDMQEVVFIVKEDGTVTKVVIRTDIQDNEYIETLSGVKEGDKVVNAPYNTISKILKEGMKVKVVDKDKVYDQK